MNMPMRDILLAAAIHHLESQEAGEVDPGHLPVARCAPGEEARPDDRVARSRAQAEADQGGGAIVGDRRRSTATKRTPKKAKERYLESLLRYQ